MGVAEPEESEGEGEEAPCGDHGACGGWSGADCEGAFAGVLVFVAVAEVIDGDEGRAEEAGLEASNEGVWYP